MTVVLPAYNAAQTLTITINDIPRDIVDDIVLVDDCSQDNTFDIAQDLNITSIRHETNLGYGGNQKTCYKEALKRKVQILL